ncbi:hypothetical protein [Massilia sp. S19_KUP03_FR1]|uniref:hypothetical protein n=1 Tax=Massilia sp. S19_KUP03_FR1 TaxID=3025503 RepID=UPI002FCD8039
MFKKLLIGLLAIVAIILSIAARQGTSFTVERSIDIRAPHAKIVPLLADLKTDVVKPVAATSQTRFTLTPTAGGTRVTWRLHGPLTFRARLISAFIGIDMLLGSELEKGLARLKTAAEK